MDPLRFISYSMAMAAFAMPENYMLNDNHEQLLIKAISALNRQEEFNAAIRCPAE